MLYTLIGTVAAGFVAGLFVFLVRYLTKWRLPGWTVPVAVGGVMILATISSEYGWYPNTVRSLPAEVEVVATRESQSWYRPWTYIAPFTDSFVAIDAASLRTNDAAPELRLVNAYVFARWSAVTELPLAVNCESPARADLVDGVSFDDDGRPQGVTWRDVAADDALLVAACG